MQQRTYLVTYTNSSFCQSHLLRSLMEPNHKNPLEIKSTEVKSTANKRGRPVNADSIKFSSPQPKSAIIAQILREKSFKPPIEKPSEQHWPSSASLDDNFQTDEDKNLIDLEVVYGTDTKRPKNKAKSNKKPKKCKASKDKEEKRFACDYPDCAYAAKLSCNLVKHKRRHTSEKPYICDACPFRTNFINSLKVHTRIHTSEKPYNCEHCGYRCNTSSNLKKHKMHRHPEVAKI